VIAEGLFSFRTLKGNVSDLYPSDLRFEFRLDHRLSLLKRFVVFLSLQADSPNRPLPPVSKSFPIYYSLSSSRSKIYTMSY
jgi:hypothetical protein